MKTSRLLLVLLLSVFALPAMQAQSLGDIRARMEKRVGPIDALKAKGILGENNRGLLEVRSGDDKGVAAAENADRAVVYAALAQKTGVTSEAVGKARARQIFAASIKGVWVQRENGEWIQK